MQNEEDPAPKKGNHHALVAINSSFDSWIIDSSATHHMATKDEVFSSLIPCSRPPILMGLLTGEIDRPSTERVEPVRGCLNNPSRSE
jgi:hypothetical protein